MSTRRSFQLAAISIALAAVGCAPVARFDTPTESGSLRVALQAGNMRDVTAIRFEIVDIDSACGSEPVATRTVPLDNDARTDVASGQAAQHAFSDALFVLPPGDYRVCATPLAGETAATNCATAEGRISVVAETTNELMLLLQCQGPTSGALDALVTLNGPPQITGLAIMPSKFISVCEVAEITVQASDPDGDALTYAFARVAGPDAGKLSSDGASARFFGPAGDYTLQVSAQDPHERAAQLSFPVHIADAACAVPSAVADIFSKQCAPCHTERVSGGLSLATPTIAYANLVGQGTAGDGCMSATRVVAGDASQSYLIAKLRNLPGICGVAMPRNKPALLPEEIQVIEDWIDGLPH